MMHGDISNNYSETVAVRVVGTLLKYKESTLKDRFLNAVLGKLNRAIINESVASWVSDIYTNSEMCVDLVVYDDERNDSLDNFLIDYFPFNTIHYVARPSQIGSKLNVNVISYYVDDDEYTRSLVNSRYAMNFKTAQRELNFRKMRKRHY